MQDVTKPMTMPWLELASEIMISLREASSRVTSYQMRCTAGTNDFEDPEDAPQWSTYQDHSVRASVLRSRHQWLSDTMYSRISRGWQINDVAESVAELIYLTDQSNDLLTLQLNNIEFVARHSSTG